MQMYLWCAAVAVSSICLAAQPLRAQGLEEGEWKAHLYTPGGELATASYEVRKAGEAYRATMTWPFGKLEVSDFRLEGSRLLFSWNPGFRMDCRLDRHPSRHYKGACRDQDGYIGPVVLAPPGVGLVPDDLDFDAAFAVWGVSRDAYEKRIYPEADRPRKVEPPVSRTVEVDGRRVNLVEQGSGGVTLVLEAGLGDDHTVWREVQRKLAAVGRIVAYDRAGLGLSEPSAAPRTPDRVAGELHALLAAAGIAPPYVLVGHEAGALYLRAFAARYPGEVKGLVLVDPAHEALAARLSALDAVSWEDYLEQKRTFYASLSEATLAEFDAFTDVLTAAPPAVADDLPDVPVVLLSALRPVAAPRWVGETAEGLAAREALHRAWAVQVRATHVVTKRSSSYVHLDEPGLVADAVLQVLREAGL